MLLILYKSRYRQFFAKIFHETAELHSFGHNSPDALPDIPEMAHL
jgi:hypothetical protein